MSEKESKEETNDVISDNVALLKAKIIGLESLVEDLTEKLNTVTGRYEQAKEFVEADKKKDLLAYIIPKVTTSKELLMLKSVDELMEIKKILDVAAMPAFKAGTPVYDKRSNPRKELDSVYSKYMAKIRGGS